MLASALATRPRLLLLDEPSAGAARQEVDFLAQLLREVQASGISLLVVEHNLPLVRAFADRVVVMADGKGHTVTRVRRLLVLALVLPTLAGCGGGGGKNSTEAAKTGTIEIAVIAPFSRESYLGNTIAKGAELGVRRVAIPVGTKFYSLQGCPLRQRRICEPRGCSHAPGDRCARGRDRHGRHRRRRLVEARRPTPESRSAIVYDGDEGLVDPEKRPNVFRIAPTNHGLAFRLAEYLIPKKLKLAFLTDDTGYGRGGRRSLDQAFAENESSVVARIQIPSSATDLAPQILQARRAHATALIVWAQPAAIAEALIAARSAGWKVPVFAPPAAEDPLVRQELAGHPDWVDGLTFAFGPDDRRERRRPRSSPSRAPTTRRSARSRSASSARRPPGDRAARLRHVPLRLRDVLLATAIQRPAQSLDGATVIAALNQVSIEGANGDQRGFNERNHEGVVDDDVYFARFKGMTYSAGQGRSAVGDAADDRPGRLDRMRARAWPRWPCGRSCVAAPAGAVPIVLPSPVSLVAAAAAADRGHIDARDGARAALSRATSRTRSASSSACAATARRRASSSHSAC